jgi:hypothetical protein
MRRLPVAVLVVCAANVLGCAASRQRDASAGDPSECLAIPSSNLSLRDSLCQESEWSHDCVPTDPGDLDLLAELFAPTAIEPFDGGVRVHGRLLRTVGTRGVVGWRRAPPADVPAFQTGWDVTYELRLAPEIPLSAFARIDPISAADAHAEYLAAEAEREGRGRALCRSSSGWDVWARPDRSYYPWGGGGAWEDAEHLPISRLDESITLIHRETRRVWYLVLQGLPYACEPRVPEPPPGPCDPGLSLEGVWVYLAVPVGHLDDTLLPNVASYCPIHPMCAPCCYPDGDRRGCLQHGFHRCDELAGWLDRACTATTLDEIPAPPGMHPCPPFPDLTNPCRVRPVHDYCCCP